jgi:hypothetical protein
VEALHGFFCWSPRFVSTCDDVCPLAPPCVLALDFSQPLVFPPMVSDKTQMADSNPMQRRNRMSEA